MKRVRLTMHVLQRELSSSACPTDARVEMDVDTRQLSIAHHDGDRLTLRVCGTRELRLLAEQLSWFADHLDNDYRPPFEEVPERCQVSGCPGADGDGCVHT